MTPGQAVFEKYNKAFITFPRTWAAQSENQKTIWEDIAAAGIAAHEERKAPEADGEEQPTKRGRKK